MKTITSNLLLVLFFIGTTAAYSQTAKEKLMQIQEAFNGKQNAHFIMNIRAFNTPKSSESYFQQRVEIKKQGDNMRYKMGDTEVLMNTSYLIWLDHAQHRIIVQDRPSNEGKEDFFQEMNLNLDSIMDQYKSIELVESQEDGTEHYRVGLDQGMIQQVDFYVGQNHLPKQLVYTYNPLVTESENVVKINFEKALLSPSFSSKVFSERNFIDKRGNTFIANHQHKNYQVHYIAPEW